RARGAPPEEGPPALAGGARSGRPRAAATAPPLHARPRRARSRRGRALGGARALAAPHVGRLSPTSAGPTDFLGGRKQPPGITSDKAGRRSSWSFWSCAIGRR